MQEMFAAAEADFQLERRNLCLEQGPEIGRRLRRQVDPVFAQAAFEGDRLLRAYSLAVPAAEETFGRPAWPVLCVRWRQAATASLSALARSVFSQEKEPSRPALRPK